MISKHPIEMTESFIAQEDNYLQPFIEIKNNTEHFTYNFPKIAELPDFIFLIYHTQKQSREYTS